MTLPWEDIEVAVQTGELDGIAWSGITEDYTVGWADVTNYFLTNNISGAWCGSYFANSEKWDALPTHLQELFRLCMDSSHYYRQYWYWGGEADLRVNGTKLKLTSIPDEEWATVEAEAIKFWDEIAAETPRTAKVVGHPAGLQRGDGQGGPAVSLHLRRCTRAHRGHGPVTPRAVTVRSEIPKSRGMRPIDTPTAPA